MASQAWCVYCRKDIPINATKCPFCNKALSDNAKVIKCPSCGKFIIKSASKCQHCGKLTVVENDDDDYDDTEELERGEEYCKYCGKPISKKVKECPYCGEKHKRPIYMRLWFRVAAVLLILSLISGGGNKDKEDEDKSETIEKSVETVSSGGEEDSKNSDVDTNADNIPLEDIVIDLDFDTTDYLKLDADVLYEYGNYMDGQKVLTVISIDSISRDGFQTKTENGREYFYSIDCKFSSKSVDKKFEKGDIVTVAGTISYQPIEVLQFLETDTVDLVDCVVIGRGEIAAEISSDKDKQIEYCSAQKIAYENAVAEKLKSERDTYISGCETVSYNDVERNPDDYKGRQIKFSGRVVQVSEGWFDGVTLRVTTSGGNTWYVTYTHKEGESRILEGDQITCYGECDGVRSYTNVIGSQVTIPALKMKYYA